MQKIGKKQIIQIGVVSLVVLVGYFGFKGCDEKKTEKYQFEKLKKGTVNKTVPVIGVLEIINPDPVLSKTDGAVVKIYIDFNDKVKKGQLLAVMDSTEIDEKLMKISTRLESARLELRAAENEVKGKRSLFKDSLISKRAMEQAELKYKVVRSKYKQISLDYQMTRRKKQSMQIVAPVSGVVLSKNVEERQLVKKHTTLFVIAKSLEKMKLIINIDEAEIGMIKEGQVVNFTVSAFPEEKFSGKINQVRYNPKKKNNMVSYESVVICENHELEGNNNKIKSVWALKPGMTASATILIDNKKDVFIVPNQAFNVTPKNYTTKKTDKFVWIKKKGVLSGNELKAVSVETGLVGDMYSELKKGLKQGDEILVRISE